MRRLRDNRDSFFGQIPNVGILASAVNQACPHCHSSATPQHRRCRERIITQIPSASAIPWPSNPNTRSILSGSGGGPMITAHAAPSAIAIQYVDFGAVAPTTRVSGRSRRRTATGLRKQQDSVARARPLPASAGLAMQTVALQASPSSNIVQPCAVHVPSSIARPAKPRRRNFATDPADGKVAGHDERKASARSLNENALAAHDARQLIGDKRGTKGCRSAGSAVRASRTRRRNPMSSGSCATSSDRRA